jgi:hypothetical protein
MPAFDVARRWKGRVMLDRAGAKLGTIVDIYYDAEADEPGWALLNTADTGGPGPRPPRSDLDRFLRTPACASSAASRPAGAA